MRAFIADKKARGTVGAFPQNLAVYRAAVAAVVTLNPEARGLVDVSRNAAYFQERGNPTIYAVELTEEEARGLGWISREEIKAWDNARRNGGTA